LIKEAKAHAGDRDDGKLHPSSISGCPTAAALAMLKLDEGDKGTHDAKMLRIFDMGTAIHRMLQWQYIKMGVIPSEIVQEDGVETVSHWVEVPIDIPEWNMVGSVDAVAEIGGRRYVVEIKSVNSNKWAKMTGPEEHHKLQAACYVKGCSKKLQGSTTVIFIYYAKDTSDIKEYVYNVTEKDYAEVKSRIGKINAMIAEYGAKGTIPVPAYEDSNKPPCRYCPWKAKCHSTLDREAWIAKLQKEKPHATITETVGTAQSIKPVQNGRTLPKRKI